MDTMVTFNLIQDVATPHNNVDPALGGRCECRNQTLNAREGDTSQYNWSEDITHEHCELKFTERNLTGRLSNTVWLTQKSVLS